MFAVASVLLYLAALVLFFRLHVLEPAVDWIRDPVSDYGARAHARLFRTYVNAGTTAAAIVTLQFFLSTAPVFPAVVIVSLFVMVVARIGVAAVPTDPKGQPGTRSGRIHLLFAIVSFAGAYTAIDNATPHLDAGAAFAALQALRFIAAASLACVVAAVLPIMRRYFGVSERVFLLSTMLWFALASVALATRTWV